MIDFSKKNYYIFDLDGTIVDLEQLNFASFRDAIQELTGKVLRYDEYLTMFAGSGSRKGFERYFSAQGITTIDGYTAVKLYREKKEKALQERFFEVVTVKPGLELFLQKLQQSGKKLAVGTSTSRHFAEMILEKSGLSRFFSVVVSVDDVQNTKPAPDIFLEALRKLGGVKSETVVFEDSINGIQSAKNSGIDYVVVHTKNGHDKSDGHEEMVIFDYLTLTV